MTGDILWTPSPERIAASQMTAFIGFLKDKYDLEFEDYDALWKWSVSDLDTFWEAIWSFFEIRSFAPPDQILGRRTQPGAEWFPGAKVNFADHVLRHAETRPDDIALTAVSETFGRSQINWAELRRKVASVASHLKDAGVDKGDRVVAILPNGEAAIVACLAAASLGAIWSLCAPDMGHTAVIDRFRQIEPKVIIVQDGYVHAGHTIDQREVVAKILSALPSVDRRIWVPVLGRAPSGDLVWEDLTHRDRSLDPVPVASDHPLWVVYSSGTTGTPKPIVHGHAGVLAEASKQGLHQDVGIGDRFCWLTSSGWIMWNVQLAALMHGASVFMFDGAPNHPDLSRVWRFVSDERLTFFGAGAAYFETCLKSGIRPAEFDLSELRQIGSTGSPLSSDGYDWVYRDVKADVWLAPISGGTDICGAFVGGNPLLPVRTGEMQSRFLGNSTYAFDPEGQAITGQVGELVCTQPLPSMPLFFWGDKDGSRLHESYYDMYPGVWRHGDWIEITETGGAVIYGRSDATINRKGLRLGSSEIYRAVEGLQEVVEALVVDLEFLGRESFMPLFVVLAEGVTLDDELKARINRAIQDQISPRFVPNEILAIDAVPRTLSGKKLELPVKKLLLGHDPSSVVNRDSMMNPESFDALVAYSERRKDPP